MTALGVRGSGLPLITARLLFAAAMLSSVPEAAAGHVSAPPPPTPTVGAPLRYCRPLHLSADPTEFRAGEAARRFTVFVDDDCGIHSGPVIVEIWYRALYRDRARSLALGTPILVTSFATRAELVNASSGKPRDLSYFAVPATGLHLHLGCYVARVRIPISPDAGERNLPAAGGAISEQVGEVEACAVPPTPSLPGPSSGSLLPPRQDRQASF